VLVIPEAIWFTIIESFHLPIIGASLCALHWQADVHGIGEGEEPEGDQDYEATVEKMVEEAKKYGDLESWLIAKRGLPVSVCYIPR